MTDVFVKINPTDLLRLPQQTKWGNEIDPIPPVVHWPEEILHDECSRIETEWNHHIVGLKCPLSEPKIQLGPADLDKVTVVKNFNPDYGVVYFESRNNKQHHSQEMILCLFTAEQKKGEGQREEKMSH